MTALEHRKRLAAPARRGQILDAAAALFIAKGFEAVSMADLAAALGVSRPAVYSYFASTEAILDVLLDERLGRLWTDLEGLLPAREGGAPPAPGLYAALFEFLTGERDSLLLLHSGGGPAFQNRRSAFLAELGRRLEAHYLKAQHPKAGRSPHQMSVMTHLLDSLAYFAVQQEVADVRGLARTLDGFMRGGLAQLATEAQEPPDAPPAD